MSVEELRKEITSGFEEWVDEPEPVSEELLKLSKKHSFDEKKVRNDFRKFLNGVGAEGDTLDDMVSRGVDLMRDTISSNKGKLWPELADSDKKLKLGGLKLKKETSASAEAEPTEAEASAEASTKKGKAKGKKEKAPKRLRGYDLFFNKNKDFLKEELKNDWEKKYKDVPYTHNPTAVSKELGARWRGQSEKGSKAEQKKNNLSDDDRKKYNDEAAEINLANGIEPKSSKQVNESDKKPLTAYQMFNKEIYPEMAEKYRTDNDLTAEDKVKPTEIMKLTAVRWNEEIKPHKDKVAEYEEKAADYNKEHGREHKPKEKEEKVSTSKTNSYREFCKWFRKDYREKNPDGNPYEEAQQMNSKWNTEIKKDEKLKSEWDEKAKEVNLERGIPVSN